MKSKRIYFLLVACLLLLFLGSCTKQSKNQTTNVATVSVENSSQEKILNNDIVLSWNETDNLTRLDTFIDNFQAGNPDEIKITTTTTEGDPIYETITYDGKKIELAYDSREDKYAAEKTVTTSTFSSVEKNEEGYFLKGEEASQDFKLAELKN